MTAKCTLTQDEIVALTNFRDHPCLRGEGVVPSEAQIGDLVQGLVTRGYLRVTNAVCGPLMHPTGELIMKITEAGRIALETVTAMPQGEYWIRWCEERSFAFGITRGTFEKACKKESKGTVIIRTNKETYDSIFTAEDLNTVDALCLQGSKKGEKFRIEGWKTIPEWIKLEDTEVSFKEVPISHSFDLDDRHYLKVNDLHARTLDNDDMMSISADARVANVKKETNVHTEHCCKNCGCKYGEATCPVVTGSKVQSFPCGNLEVCGEF